MSIAAMVSVDMVQHSLRIGGESLQVWCLSGGVFLTKNEAMETCEASSANGLQ